MKRIWLLFLVLTLVLTTSCTVQLVVKTQPEGAHIYLNDEYVGESPCEAYFSFVRESVKVRAEKKGYKPYEGIVHKSLKVYHHSTSYRVAHPDEPPATVTGEWPSEVYIRLIRKKTNKKE